MVYSYLRVPSHGQCKDSEKQMFGYTYFGYTVAIKVIIYKSRREVSSIEQYTIDCEYLVYLKFITES